MLLSQKLSLRLAAAATACIFLPAAARAVQGVAVYVSAPTVTSAENSNLVPMNSETISTETFDGTGFAGITAAKALPNPYTSTALGGDTFTPSGSVTVHPNTDSYGGYNQGNYLSIPSGGLVTLDLGSTGVGYVGFDFYAGDANNKFTVFSGSNNLGTYSTSNLITLLPNIAGRTVTDVANGTYNTTAYYGQQVTGKTTFTDTKEPFAYINLFATGENITSIIFRQTNSAAFETDNFSILTTAPDVPGTQVYAGQVPEPSAWLGVAVGMVGFIVLRTIRRRRHARGAR